MTTLVQDLVSGVALLTSLLAKLSGIINGPSSGDGSLITIDAGTVRSMARLQAEMAALASLQLADITGTTFTIAPEHNGYTLMFSSDDPIVVTIPGDLTAPLKCLLVQKGAGQITIEEGAGATVVCGLDQPGADHRKTAYQWAAITIHIDENSDDESAHCILYGATTSV